MSLKPNVEGNAPDEDADKSGILTRQEFLSCFKDMMGTLQQMQISSPNRSSDRGRSMADYANRPSDSLFDADLETIDRHFNPEQRSQARFPGPGAHDPRGFPNYADQQFLRNRPSSPIGSAMTRDPQIKMPEYGGTGDAGIFIACFEKLAENYQWGEMEMVDRLFQCLKGPAKNFVVGLPPYIMSSYSLIKPHLVKRFGTLTTPATIRRQLGSMHQKIIQSNEEYAEEIYRLVIRAYPGMSIEMTEQLAAEHFLHGYKDRQIAYEVLRMSPKSLDEALAQINNTEHSRRATPARETKKNDRLSQRVIEADLDAAFAKGDEHIDSVRSASSRTEVTSQFDQLLNQIKAAMERMGTGNSARQGPSQAKIPVRKFECFSCGGEDHFAKKCPNIPHSKCPERNLHQEGSTSTMVTHLSKRKGGDVKRVEEAKTTTEIQRGEVSTDVPTGDGSESQPVTDASAISSYQPSASVSDASDFNETTPVTYVHSMDIIDEDIKPDISESTELELCGEKKNEVDVKLEDMKNEKDRVSVKVNDLEATAVTDMGADATVVSVEVAENAGLCYKDRFRCQILNAESDAEMVAYGGVTATLHVADHYLNWPVDVAPIWDSMLLGIDFLPGEGILTGQGDLKTGNEIVTGQIGKSDTFVIAEVIQDGVSFPKSNETTIHISSLQSSKQNQRGITEDVDQANGSIGFLGSQRTQIKGPHLPNLDKIEKQFINTGGTAAHGSSSSSRDKYRSQDKAKPAEDVDQAVGDAGSLRTQLGQHHDQLPVFENNQTMTDMGSLRTCPASPNEEEKSDATTVLAPIRRRSGRALESRLPVAANDQTVTNMGSLRTFPAGLNEEEESDATIRTRSGRTVKPPKKLNM